MATRIAGLVVLDPTVLPLPVHASMARRQHTLDGMTIGLLANGKRNADKLLDKVGALLAEHYQIKGFVVRNKGSANRPCPPNLLQELLAQCDALLTGVGD